MLLGFPGWVVQGFSGVDRVLLGLLAFSGVYWVLLAFSLTWFCWVLVGLAGFSRVSEKHVEAIFGALIFLPEQNIRPPGFFGFQTMVPLGFFVALQGQQWNTNERAGVVSRESDE